MLHPASVRHSGHRISAGERWVLVLFLNTMRLHAGEHGRRFRARAQELFNKAQEEAEEEDDDDDEEEEEEEEGEEEKVKEEEAEEEEEEEAENEEADEELRCLLHALQATGEADHEVGVRVRVRAMLIMRRDS